MRKLLSSIVILFVALLLFTIFAPIWILYAIIYTVVYLDFVWAINYIANIIIRIAVSIDQLWNVFAWDLLNLIMIKDNTISFWDEDQTVSEVLARNQDNLTVLWKIIVLILEAIDPWHMEKSKE